MNKTLQNAITKFNYPLTPSSGHATSVGDFFNQLIAPQFSNKEAIRSLHNSLMEYIELPASRFFIRSFGSSRSPEYYSELRRGFVTEYPNNTRYTFCDNTFALIFANMKLSGHVPSAQELYAYFDQQLVKCGFKSTREEAELAFYNAKGAAYSKLNAEKWYLAHINSVAANYAGISFTEKRDQHFPRGERSHWDQTTKMRHVAEEPSTDEIALLRAHFIRLTHPLNNFLVPNRKCLKFDRGHLIGEDPKLIEYVEGFLKQEFPKEYNEMMAVVMSEPKNSPLPPIQNIHWDKTALTVDKKTGKDTPVKTSGAQKKTKDNARQPKTGVSSEISDVNSLLGKIGKLAYVYIFRALMEEGLDISLSDVRPYLPDHISTVKNTVVSARLSKAKKIFRESKEKEALELVLGSTKTWTIARGRPGDEDIRGLAEKLYADYYENNEEIDDEEINGGEISDDEPVTS